MKRSIAVILTLVMCLSLIGCGGVPAGMSKSAYEIGVKALKITDQYIDADISADEAHAKLSDLSDRIDSLPYSTENIKDRMVGIYIDSISYELIRFQMDYSSIVEDRDKLANVLGR